MAEFRDTAPLKFSRKKDSALSLFFLSKSPGGQDDHNVDVYLQVNHRSQAPLKKRSFHIVYPVVRGQGAWSREYQNFFRMHG